MNIKKLLCSYKSFFYYNLIYMLRPKLFNFECLINGLKDITLHHPYWQDW